MKERLVSGAIYRAIRDPFPKLGTQSGFRKKLCEDLDGKTIKDEWAYIALQTTGEVPEWPDKLDEATGIFTYYGDQQDLTKDIHDTKQKGNQLLRDVFNWLHTRQYEKIPPFFIFQNIEGEAGVKFLGLAVPGNLSIPYGEDLQLAKDIYGNKVNNYVARFTILHITDSITYEWLQARITNKRESNKLAPKAWQAFIQNGLVGVENLKKDEEIVATIEKEVRNSSLDNETKKELINARINQSVFKTRLLQRYSKCCLCGVHDPVFLRARHIKPWDCCNVVEKLDVDNGILLCPNHNSLFESGYISFEDDGSIVISDKWNNYDRVFMNVYPEMKIPVVEGNKKYLKYHRENVLR